MIGIVQTSARQRGMLWHYDGRALRYTVLAEVMPYFGSRPKPGAFHVLADGRRTMGPAGVRDAIVELAHYWQAVCWDGDRLVADYRIDSPAIYRYRGSAEGFPYELGGGA